MPVVVGTWPGSLPSSPQWGGGESRESNVIRSQNAGPKKMRRRYTATSIIHQWPITLTAAQVATLETFFRTTLSEVGVFDGLNHPRSGAAMECRFRAAPAYSNIGPDAYRTVLQLEELPTPSFP